MSHTDDCPQGQSQNLTFESTDTVVMDKKTFMRILSLVGRSVDELSNARHREVFLDCLNTYLLEIPAQSQEDDSYIFRATLLLDSYYEYVSPTLALLDTELQEAYDLMRAVKSHD